jgi:arylsulfatase A-like enzyme
MIARWPGKIRPGAETDHVSAFWDFLPTACELGGVEPPEHIDGISYLPTLLADEAGQKKHEYLYWEYYSHRAVRMGKWKAVGQRTGDRLQLFDLEADLGETTNVASDHPQVVARMREIIADAHVDSPHFK